MLLESALRSGCQGRASTRKGASTTPHSQGWSTAAAFVPRHIPPLQTSCKTQVRSWVLRWQADTTRTSPETRNQHASPKRQETKACSQPRASAASPSFPFSVRQYLIPLFPLYPLKHARVIIFQGPYGFRGSRGMLRCRESAVQV